jgi:hypothetical protein
MTIPGRFPFDIPAVDINSFCCADSVAGGCGHPLTDHNGPSSECRGVFGCSCTRLRKHKARCIHNAEAEVSE